MQVPPCSATYWLYVMSTAIVTHNFQSHTARGCVWPHKTTYKPYRILIKILISQN